MLESFARACELRPVLRVLGHGLLAIALTLCAGEALVRLTIAGPSPQVYDEEIGYTYAPHSQSFQAKEGMTRLRFNAYGLNDEDVLPKDGRCRVLAIGDSYTAALQVPQAQNFTSVAEQLDKQLDVVNGGRDGLFLGDLHKVFNKLANDVKPDLVVYVVSKRAVEEDIHLSDFSVSVDLSNGTIRDAVMRVEGKEAVKQMFAPILRESALATRLAAQLQPTLVDTLRQIQGMRGWFASLEAKKTTRPAVTASKPSDEDVLSFVFQRLSQRGPAAILYMDALTYLPNQKAQVASLSKKAEDLARKAAERAGIRFFNTSDYLIESVERTGQPPYGFDNAVLPGGHLNSEGHRAVGKALVDLVHGMRSSLPAECQAK